MILRKKEVSNLYICQVCGQIPDVNDRAVIVLTDSVRAEIKGHRDCISSVEVELDKIRSKNKGKMTVRALFKAMKLDIEDHLVDW